MRDHHTTQHSHANLVGTDTRDCHLEQQPQGTCFNEKLMSSSQIYQMLSVGYESNGKDRDET